MELPAISQIGFVVANLELELPRLRSLYGDFIVRRFTNEGFWYRDSLCDCVVDVAFGVSGDLELEILQPISGAGPHREFLEKGGHGLHHLQHRVQDIDPYVAWLGSQGYECIWRMPRRGDAAVAYMSRRNDPLIVELVEPLHRPPRSTSES